MTTMPAPESVPARAAWAMTRVPSADVRRRSWEPAEPPAIGRIGGRESLSTHMGPPERGLQRDRQQRVEAAAVADDDALAEGQRGAVDDQDVDIAAGGEEVHRAVAHDADDEERGLGAHAAVGLAEDRGQADQVTVRLALVDARLAERRDPVTEHAPGVGVDDAHLQPLPVGAGRRDPGDALLDAAGGA